MSLVVVVPAYNAARHVRGVLARVLAVPDLEVARVVVVDDGSADSTRSEVAALAANDPRVELVVRPTNGGDGAAVKKGLEAPRGAKPAFAAFVRPDGEYKPPALPPLPPRMR